MILGKRIKELRKQRNMRQEDLGELLDVSKVSVCQWEKGIKVPSTKNLILLSKILGVDVEYLVGNDVHVVASDDENYTMTMAKEEINIINELKRHEALYKDLLENPKRTFERIDKSFY